MSAVAGLSIREFARRDGCDEKIVRRKVASGHLSVLPDGKLDPALVGTAWRKRADIIAGSADSGKMSAPAADMRPGESSEQAAERIVFKDGRVFRTEAEAKRHKESFLALQKELDYDRELGSVVPIDDVVAAVAAEYALVRNRMLSIATRVAPRAAILKSAEQVRDLVASEVALALKELSLDAGGDLDPADAREAVRGRFKKPH